ncbi:18676_t:CDS:2 [Acaulospora morrowiae]|uniref:18676_t:CDS:1 n=1 Tax=Acaulospora morrowiae TaxID=94023 RepID=A0A9N9FXR6_9GLOM|nr:18676_t:CDS:2 [Acaulospora morrowiae]
MENNNNHPLSPFNLNDDSEILNTYRYVNGRRYHNVPGVDYFLPNDEEEVSRLDLQHKLVRYAWEGNFTAPMHKRLSEGNCRVLDVGCGSGAFIMDLAEDYPKNSYVGIDISDTFPGESVHVQWKEKVIPELLRVLKPGGWIELMEFDLIWFSLGPKTGQVTKIDQLQKRGISIIMSTRIAELLKESNVQNMQIISKSLPIGPWGGKLGELLYKSHIQVVTPVMERLVKSVKMTIEEYLEISTRETDEHKTYAMSHRIFGVKPQN